MYLVNYLLNEDEDKDEDKDEDEDDEDEDDEDDEDEDDEDDEDENESSDSETSKQKIIKSNNQIEKIFKFIVKSTSNKNLNQTTLKKISEIYWNKTINYDKSIKLFESDMITKKFTKIYKENSK